MNSPARRAGVRNAARLRSALKSRLTSSSQNCRAIDESVRHSVSASFCPQRWQYSPRRRVPQLLQMSSVTVTPIPSTTAARDPNRISHVGRPDLRDDVALALVVELLKD